jgi:hypothetical protein
MSVSGTLTFENGKTGEYRGKGCFGFLWSVACFQYNLNLPISDLKSITFNLNSHINAEQLSLIKSIPVFNIFSYDEDSHSVSIDVANYKADRIIFTLQFIRNVRDYGSDFDKITKTYKPIVGFLLNDNITQDFYEKYYITNNYDCDNSVFMPDILSKTDVKAILEHDKSNADTFTNQGTFKEQGCYYKGYMFRFVEFLEKYDLSPNIVIETTLRSSFLNPYCEHDMPRTVIRLCNLSVTDASLSREFEHFEPTYTHDEGMMVAWKQNKRAARRGSGDAFSSRCENSSLEGTIDKWLSYIGVEPEDYKL